MTEIAERLQFAVEIARDGHCDGDGSAAADGLYEARGHQPDEAG